LEIWAWSNETSLRSRARRCGIPVDRVQIIAHTRIPAGPGWLGLSVLPREARAFARAIYGELHRADEAGADLIVVEALPEGSDWRPIADRLIRAAAA
jgi:L-threonylcarbamoyladenylate synthase